MGVVGLVGAAAFVKQQALGSLHMFGGPAAQGCAVLCRAVLNKPTCTMPCVRVRAFLWNLQPLLFFMSSSHSASTPRLELSARLLMQ